MMVKPIKPLGEKSFSAESQPFLHFLPLSLLWKLISGKHSSQTLFMRKRCIAKQSDRSVATIFAGSGTRQNSNLRPDAGIVQRDFEYVRTRGGESSPAIEQIFQGPADTSPPEPIQIPGECEHPTGGTGCFASGPAHRRDTNG